MVAGRKWLMLSALLGAVYLGYVLWAKFAAVLGPPPVKLGEVGEFLLFLAAVVAFTIQVFVEDAQRVETGAGEQKDNAP